MPGPPSNFKPEYVEQARKLAERGLTDAEIADFFEAGHRTFYKWRNQFPEFAEALRIGKEVPDERVKRSLYNRAVGYRYVEQQLTKSGEVVDIERELPPDVTACIFWLKNRDRANWRDKHEIEHEGNVTVNTVSFADAVQKKAANAA